MFSKVFKRYFVPIIAREIKSLSFRKISIESWNLSIKKEINSGKFNEAVGTWLLMKNKNVVPDSETRQLLLNLFKNMRNKEELLKILDEFKKSGDISTDSANIVLDELVRTGDERFIGFKDKYFTSIKPNAKTYSLLISGFAKMGNSKMILSLFQEMKENNFELENSTVQVLLDKGNLYQLSKSIPDEDLKQVITITLKSKNGSSEELENLYREYFSKQQNAPQFAYEAFIIGFSRVGNINMMKQVCKEIFEKKIALTERVAGAIIKGYAKVKDTKAIAEFIRNLKNQQIPLTVSIVNDIIRALSLTRRFHEAIQLFHIMKSPHSPVKPNYKTIYEMLSGSAHLRDPLMVEYFRHYGLTNCTNHEGILLESVSAFLECGESQAAAEIFETLKTSTELTYKHAWRLARNIELRHINHLNPVQMRAILQARDSLKRHGQNFSAMESLNDKISEARQKDLAIILDALKLKPKSNNLISFSENLKKK